MELSEMAYWPLPEDYFLNYFLLKKPHYFGHLLCPMLIIDPHGFGPRNCQRHSSAVEKATERPNAFCG